jgi:hypothetical protein
MTAEVVHVLHACKTCGRPAKVRVNGRSLGYCEEHMPGRRAEPIGTIRQHKGRMRVKTESGWQLCNPDGSLRSETDPWVAGRLSDVMDRYKLRPVDLVLPHAAVSIPEADRAHIEAFKEELREIGARLPVPTGPMVRSSDPETSRRAAERVAQPGALTAQQFTVLDAIVCSAERGCTQDEMRVYPPSAGKRRLELERAGLVELVLESDEVSGGPVVRESRRGCAQRVYRATIEGVDAWKAHAHE